MKSFFDGIFINKSRLLEENIKYPIKLEYYKTIAGNEDVENKYGIEIVKTEYKNGDINIESNEAPNITNNIDEAHKIENYIESVQDSDIRLIISKRFLNCKTWEQVGKELFTDRTTPYYKLKNYLKKENLNENKKEDNKLI